MCLGPFMLTEIHPTSRVVTAMNTVQEAVGVSVTRPFANGDHVQRFT